MERRREKAESPMTSRRSRKLKLLPPLRKKKEERRRKERERKIRLRRCNLKRRISFSSPRRIHSYPPAPDNEEIPTEWARESCGKCWCSIRCFALPLFSLTCEVLSTTTLRICFFVENEFVPSEYLSVTWGLYCTSAFP